MIDKSLWINQGEQYKQIVKDFDGKISIGDFTYGAPTFRRYHKNTNITIGKFCSIAVGVDILIGGEHRTDMVTTNPADITKQGLVTNDTSKGDIIIGNDVWVGFGATILSGVTIGDGAVIGARAVVTKNVAPYMIVAGNPIREIRCRLSKSCHELVCLRRDCLVTKLMKIKWWDWPGRKIVDQWPYIQSENVNEFVKIYGLKEVDKNEKS